MVGAAFFPNNDNTKGIGKFFRTCLTEVTEVIFLDCVFFSFFQLDFSLKKLLVSMPGKSQSRDPGSPKNEGREC